MSRIDRKLLLLLPLLAGCEDGTGPRRLPDLGGTWELVRVADAAPGTVCVSSADPEASGMGMDDGTLSFSSLTGHVQIRHVLRGLCPESLGQTVAVDIDRAFRQQDTLVFIQRASPGGTYTDTASIRADTLIWGMHVPPFSGALPTGKVRLRYER